ncbi:D-alanyl-D-alanine carboxypeptidase [Paenalkalicoccus suaedae]|uniref:serine-type D-Ala-D-Ala carboxypeptidase n=1 Tax=Paenalkalicoccus suaedae TaxID=2592382 RepID=A0A859F960_9BACI|nr:D-alanyl-D-alanine carboxypeptidase family protein [Paenalkalicoccus suaedae]QKS69603.1 D-alanyl-D-alanine carboxypeptidase [Paenalkalicoccus suaedae]
MAKKLHMSALAGIVLLAGVMATPVKAFEPTVDTAILVDAETGRILYELNAEQALPPASMTKMMSEYLILEAVNEGQISWDDQVEVNEFLAGLSQDRALSNVMMRSDQTYSVKELYESVAIYSANAATMALADHIAGSEGAFVELMNERGEELGLGTPLRTGGAEAGMDNLDAIAEQNLGTFQYVNSTGLPNRLLNGSHPEGTNEEDDNYMSAKATATLAYHLINNYPEVLDTASIPEKIFREGTTDAITMQNWNWMLPGTQYGDLDYEYVDGLKTGFTNTAGYTFTGTGEKEGERLITVVMGADSEAHRFNETERLLEWGFGRYYEEEIFPANMTLDSYETLAVDKGEEDTVTLATSDAFSELITEGEEEMFSYSVELNQELLNEEGQIEAPVEEGQVIGQMIVEFTGEEQPSYLPGLENTSNSVDIVTTSSVERAGWFSLTMRNIGDFFSGLWGSVTDTVRGWL